MDEEKKVLIAMPDTAEVSGGFIDACVRAGVTYGSAFQAFELWLAARDRVVAANAWDEGYGQGVRDNERDMEPADNPYRITEENN